MPPDPLQPGPDKLKGLFTYFIRLMWKGVVLWQTHMIANDPSKWKSQNKLAQNYLYKMLAEYNPGFRGWTSRKFLPVAPGEGRGLAMGSPALQPVAI